MSIVTDALNRLQSARAHLIGPTSAAQDHDSSKSKETEPQAEQNESTYDTKFLTVSVGSFLVIATMAMGAFWWGESLVVEAPQLTMSASSHTVEPLVEKNVDLLASEQKTSVTPEPTTELSALEQETVSQEVERQEDMPSLQDSEEKEHEQIVRLALHDNEEPILKKGAILDEATQSGAQEFESRAVNQEQPIYERPSASLSEVRALKNREVISSSSSGLANRDVPGQSFASASVNSKEQSQSDLPMNVATLAKSEKKVSEIAPAISQPQSPPSLPSVTAKNPRPSSQMRPPQVQTLVRKTDASVPQPRSRLSPEQRLVKAQLLIEQQSHAEALEVLNPLFATLPDTWEPWFWMGTAQLGVGNLDKAENAFMEGLVRDDTVPYLWVQRAVIEQQRGQYRQAMDALRQAELLAPDLPEVQLNLAYNLEHQGNQKLARRHYQQYLSLTEGTSAYHAVRRKVLERVLRMGSS